MLSVFALSFIMSVLFMLRWTMGGGLLFAVIEIITYIIFILVHYKAIPTMLNYLFKKNIILVGLLIIFFVNTILSLLNAIIIDVDQWIQICGLNVRNIFIMLVGGIIFVKLEDDLEKNIISCFWIFIFFGFIQNIISVIITHELAGLLLNGIGVSYIALFALYLFSYYRNIIMKLVTFILILASNSLSAIVAYFMAIMILRMRKIILPIIGGGILIYSFLLGYWGDRTLFRKSPEVLISGTGRFEKYSGCIANFNIYASDTASCHSSYLTLMNQYGVFGFLECLIFVSSCIIFYVKSYKVRKDKKLWFIFSVIIFISANDFLLVTPSHLTIAFCILLLHISRSIKYQNTCRKVPS